jgi:SHS2 domain-containing protein
VRPVATGFSRRYAQVYRWVEHTAELELELDAATERGVLADALRALEELLEGGQGRPGDRVGEPCSQLERRALRAAARDRPALLAAWLEELLFLSESEGFIPVEIEDLSLGADWLSAIVAGRIGESRPLVKAVTYHRLRFEPAEGRYRGRVVFDV